MGWDMGGEGLGVLAGLPVGGGTACRLLSSVVTTAIVVLSMRRVATGAEGGPSPDGSRPVGGRKCKKLRDPAAKHFRATWLEAVP